MALFYPTLETISKFRVAPTEGEKAVLHFLNNVLDDSFEVYFNPYLNSDRPDVLIMRKDYGVMIIEVKDWNLANFRLDERKNWIYEPNDSVVKSPVSQVLKYKDNLYNLHVDTLLAKKILDWRHFYIVSCAVYFHCASQYDVEEMLVNPFKKDWKKTKNTNSKKYLDFLKYNVDLIGRDGLEPDNFGKLLQKRRLQSTYTSSVFTRDLYDNFKRILSPSIHLKTQGEYYHYNEKQKEIIYSTTLEQRVKGLFGSGKTTVLAARAVQAYKRALQRTTNPRILILTFNITLKNFIHDKLNRVNEEFRPECFTIINYHTFINGELNNMGKAFDIPQDLRDTGNTQHILEYLDTNYYSNYKLFASNKENIQPYDAVFIDEIQDYRRVWMDIVKNCFRSPEGDYVLFGDVKQNIYGLPTEQKDVVTNVSGRPNELKYCYRSDTRVRDLAQAFQRSIFKQKYDVDDFAENNTYGALGLTFEKEGYVNYMYLPSADSITALYHIVRENILNKANNISPNDITVLGYTIDTLRDFDCYYRYACNEKTATMMETIEIMYKTGFNKAKDLEGYGGWLQNILPHLQKKLYPDRTKLQSYEEEKLKTRLSRLLTVYRLYARYGDNNVFAHRLEKECAACGLSLEVFLAWHDHYREGLKEFDNDVFSADYDYIRNNKKLHFWMNSGTIKISTINSFKGWESEVVFLIIEPIYENRTTFNGNFDELLYTGLTRAQRDLIIINFGNEVYDKKLRSLVNAVKGK